MLKELVKAIKRGNKKKSVNITTAAVIVFLLSCSSAMGERIEITQTGEEDILFNGDTYDEATHPFKENTFINNIYTNNVEIKDNISDGGIGCGLYIQTNKQLELEINNNGLITGIRNDKNGYGIWNNASEIEKRNNNGIIYGECQSAGSGIRNTGIINYIENNGLVYGEGKSTSSGIRNNKDAVISNIKNDGLIYGYGKNGSGYGIYNYIGIINNIENDGIIYGEGESNDSLGIRNDGSINSIKNSGIIYGYTAKKSGHGIFNNKEKTINNIENNGMIYGNGAEDSYMTGSGILSSYGRINSIENNGIIYGYGDNGYGIWSVYESAVVEKIKNDGVITGKAIKSQGAGIYNYSAKLDKLENKGTIIGMTSGDYEYSYGITNNEASSEITIDNLGIVSGIGLGDNAKGTGLCLYSTTKNIINNFGVIYGNTYAINGYDVDATKGNNYGLLLNETDGKNVVNVITIGNAGTETFRITNYGIVFKIKSDNKYEISYRYDGNEIITADMFSKKREMMIKNAVTSENGSESFSENNYENSIVNGITDTIKISGTENIIEDSVVNAYTSAIKFDNNEDNSLIISGSVINGGLDDKGIAIKGDSKNDELILESGEVKFKDRTSEKINTVINGNIDLGDGDDILSIGTETIVNGNLDGGAGNDILNFGIESKAKSFLDTKDKINILHNISNFKNINVNENTSLTFFEDVEITGLKEIKITETGVLSLRLKDSEKTVNVDGKEISKAEHALLGNEMTIFGEGDGESIAGTLNFITNGIGREIYVDMTDIELKNLYIKTSSIIDVYKITEGKGIILGAYNNLDGIYRPENTRPPVFPPEVLPPKDRYDSLNDIYKGIYSSTGDNLNALRTLISFDNLGNNYDENMSDEEQLKNLMSYLNSIYTESPYSFSSELSRKSMGMFRDIVTENQFRPELNKWMIMGGLTHGDGGTKDTYYGKNYHGIDTGTADTDVDMKLSGAYALGKYGYSENVSLGITAGGNRSEAELSMSKVKGNSGYIGIFAENYRGNFTLKAGGGIQYSEYDTDRRTIGGYSYDEKYSDMAYDIYLNGRCSNPIGDNLFLEPYGTLSYTYIKQGGADEGNKDLTIKTDSKSFDYTTAKVGVDIKKVIPHEKGKSTLSAGVSYTRLLNGADEEYITGRFKDGSDFDILVAHKNEHSIGLNAKYALELENGVLFDVKGTYAVEKDSNNGTGKSRTKGEWVIGIGLGYRF